MADPAEPNGQKEVKNRRRQATVLVAVPGWPSQDPGRLMIWSVRPSPQKAARMIKRLRKQLPEYEWSSEMLTATEAREIKLAPFVLSGPFAEPVQVKFGRTKWTVTPVRKIES